MTDTVDQIANELRSQLSFRTDDSDIQRRLILGALRRAQALPVEPTKEMHLVDTVELYRQENQRLRERLAEVREVWAGAEIVGPIFDRSQEKYVIGLCEQMHDLAVEALK